MFGTITNLLSFDTSTLFEMSRLLGFCLKLLPKTSDFLAFTKPPKTTSLRAVPKEMAQRSGKGLGVSRGDGEVSGTRPKPRADDGIGGIACSDAFLGVFCLGEQRIYRDGLWFPVLNLFLRGVFC